MIQNLRVWGSIFSHLTRWHPGIGEYNSVAAIVVVSHLACPWCSTVFRGFFLGIVSRKVYTNIGTGDPQGGWDERFGITHLANPVKCPYCRREFRVFVGVEADLEAWPSRIRRVHVVVARGDEPWVEALSRWPHRGLVAKEVLEYTPNRVYVYKDINHFNSYNSGSDEVVVASLPADVVGRNNPDNDDYGGPISVDVG